jgi:aminopeptidase N
MAKKKLSEHFAPEEYKISEVSGQLQLRLKGRRIGRPSKRLAFHQKGLKITSARIIYTNKNKIIEHEVARINHLPTIDQVRIHTAQLQYPGEYEVRLTFSAAKKSEAAKLKGSDLKNAVLREHFPSIDEPEAKIKIKLTVEP